MAVYLSATTTYASGANTYNCTSGGGIYPYQDVEYSLWCSGYGFAAQYVTMERVGQLAVQELRVWRGGERRLHVHQRGHAP